MSHGSPPDHASHGSPPNHASHGSPPDHASHSSPPDHASHGSPPDHAWRRALDDATYATLSSLTLFNNVEVVNALAADPNFLRQLFLSLEAASSSDPEWADLVAFLQVCGLWACSWAHPLFWSALLAACLVGHVCCMRWSICPSLALDGVQMPVRQP